MTVSLRACLSAIANLREQSSLGGTELSWFSLAVVRSQVFADGRWESKWMTLALLNNHSAPLWFHTPAVVSVLVEPFESVSGVKLGIEMGKFIVWRQVETLSYKIHSVLKSVPIWHTQLYCINIRIWFPHSNEWCFEKSVLMSYSVAES